MGGIRDSVAGRRVTSAFMSLSNSSSWFRTGARVTEKEGQARERQAKEEMEPGKEMRSQKDRYSQKKRARGHRCQRTREENNRSRQKQRVTRWKGSIR